MRYIFRYLEIFSYMRYICSRALIYEVHHTTLSRDILQTPGRSHIRTFNVYTRSLPWELRMKDESNCHKHCKSQSVKCCFVDLCIHSSHRPVCVLGHMFAPPVIRGLWPSIHIRQKTIQFIGGKNDSHYLWIKENTVYWKQNYKMHISLQKVHGEGYKC